jgi:hypothetical protein
MGWSKNGISISRTMIKLIFNNTLAKFKKLEKISLRFQLDFFLIRP